MAGNLPIPVQRTRSHRTLMLAGTAAMLIATSQWARWAGFIDWDLLSAALGLAQSAQMSASSDVGPAPFDCPNHSLDAQSLALSGNVLKSVGRELCSNAVAAEAQMLRGTDGSFADPSFATRQRGRQLIRPSVSLVDHTSTKVIKAHGFALASIEAPRTVSNRELLDEIESRVPNLDILDPCLGRRSSDCGSGGGSDHGDGSHGGGEGGESGDHDQIDHEDGDHSGSSDDGDSDSGESGDSESHSGDDGDSHDGGGVDTGENDGSHGDGEDSADSSHGGDGSDGGVDTAQEDHGGGDSGGGDSGDQGGDDNHDEDHSGSGSGSGGDGESHSGSGHS